ncbi:MAG: hypothetical protein NTZ33_04745 [Bacteroidetes bacterium]|nr:hypothetical protein [Bacteroidota bacterium]
MKNEAQNPNLLDELNVRLFSSIGTKWPYHKDHELPSWQSHYRNGGTIGIETSNRFTSINIVSSSLIANKMLDLIPKDIKEKLVIQWSEPYGMQLLFSCLDTELCMSRLIAAGDDIKVTTTTSKGHYVITNMIDFKVVQGEFEPLGEVVLNNLAEDEYKKLITVLTSYDGTTPQNDLIHFVTVDITPQYTKPSQPEVFFINDNINVVTGMTINEISYFSTDTKGTIVPALLAGTRSNNNWVSQSVYYLDFDETIKVDDALDKFKEFDITPNFYYFTFSHVDDKCPRFRLVYSTDSVIYDPDQQKFHIIQMVKTVFNKEADPLCTDISRMYFGGNEPKMITSLSIDINKLIDFVSNHVITKDNGKRRKIGSKWVELLHIYSNTRLETESSGTIKYIEELGSFKNNYHDFDLLSERIKIFNDFVNGKQLSHNEIFGLATNLRWFKGGIKYMKEMMLKHNNMNRANYTKHKFTIFNCVDCYDYLPMKLENFSPYEEDHQYYSLIAAVKVSRFEPEIIMKPELISLEEGEKLHDKALDDALTSYDTDIHIIIAPTGIGRGRRLEKITNEIIICQPTHLLKNETSERMKKAGNSDHVIIPEFPTFNDESRNQMFRNLFDLGMSEAVNIQLNNIAEMPGYDESSKKDRQLAEEYINNLEMCRNIKGKPLLTTHIRGLYSDNPGKEIIFDEDPIENVLEIKDTTLTDLYKLKKLLKNESFDKLYEKVNAAEPGIFINIDKVDVKREDMIAAVSRLDISTNVFKFIKAAAFIRDTKHLDKIYYVIHHKLPEDKKVIILSATPMVDIYKKLYGDRVKVTDISNIKLNGYITQYPARSMSRSGMTAEDVEWVISLSGNLNPIITFKTKKELFKNASNTMHYNNAEGYDEYCGDDISVVGTPHANEIVYKLWGGAIGIDVNDDDCKLNFRNIVWDSRKFVFFTYENKELQNLQLRYIESELLQAVGRARPLREDVEVKVFSNFPLLIANEFIYNTDY